ncbi:CyP450 monooxygenase [Trametes elegans]|nr:CyP450 monooxygenase [Trametes elegans]
MILVLLAALLGVGLLLTRNKRRFRLPPGPRGWPLVGNIFDIPRAELARGFRDLTDTYGPLVYLQILDQSILILGSYEAASDLLDKRSRNYADRPPAVMPKLATLSDWSLPVLPYGPHWRQHRRIFHQSLQLQTINTRYSESQRRVTHGLLRNLLESPTKFEHHLEHAFAASVLSIGYGIEISHGDDHYVNILQHARDIAEDVVVPGKYVVEALPVLQYLPSWFPGTAFLTDARALREALHKVKYDLFEEGRKRLECGSASESILSAYARQANGLPGTVDEEEIASAMATVYIAGSDTTIASTTAFLLAMAMNPDVQRKAQEELDKVIGSTRLPDFDDREHLPYINALVKEVSRWNVVAPIGLVRAAIEDDEYHGFHIPKGTILFPNLWAFSRDPDVYPNPEAFNPERFLKHGQLDPDVRDPYTFIFGYGRRICPGRYLADSSLFLTCACILHAFNIAPPLDENGRPVKLEAKMTTNTIISHPKPFQCVITPRFAEAIDLVKG